MKYLKFLLPVLICGAYSFSTIKTSSINYTFFRVMDKGGCYTHEGFETFMMPDRLNYDLKNKIIKKRKEALKTDRTTIFTDSFTLKPTDWIVIYEAEYKSIACKSGDKTSIKCIKVSDKSKIQEAVQKKLNGSILKDNYISHQIVLQEQPANVTVKEETIIKKIMNQMMDFLTNGEKKEFKQKSTAIGVRG